MLEKTFENYCKTLEEKGIERGVERGREEGRHLERMTVARNLIKSGMSVEKVMEMTGLARDAVEALL